MSGWAKHAAAAAVVGTSIAVTVPADAAEVMFVGIAEIKGDSVATKHAGEIDVMSWSWGVSNAGSAGSRSTFQHLTITKTVDSSSPKLVLASARGQSFKEIVLSATRSAESRPSKRCASSSPTPSSPGSKRAAQRRMARSATKK
jgi:Type VI secretion system effector, Hcp